MHPTKAIYTYPDGDVEVTYEQGELIEIKDDSEQSIYIGADAKSIDFVRDALYEIKEIIDYHNKQAKENDND